MDKAPDAFRTISEVADELDVPQHVLRFWETRFGQIKPMKRGGGRRYYRPDDVDLLRGIRHLLYGEGYTIRGVQRILKDDGIKAVQAVWKEGAAQPAAPQPEDREDSVEPADEETETVPAAEEAPVAAPTLTVMAPAPARDAATREVPARQFSRENFQPVTKPTAPEAIAAEPSAVPMPVLPPVVQTGLLRDDVRKLQTMLYELGECRRLLEVALKDEG